MAERTVFVLGAGASLAAAQARRSVQTREHPPLDTNFFARVARYRSDAYRDLSGRSLFSRVATRARTLGEHELSALSLEGYLGRLYFNVQHDPLASGVQDYFTLVDLYAREVIGTTEWMLGVRAARRDNELLRRMLQAELSLGNEISIVTFNIDLLVEDTLDVLSHSRPGAPWTLADAYGFRRNLDMLHGKQSTKGEFPTDPGTSAIRLYKLHGSVNWLFQLRDYYPGADLMTNRRELYLWANRDLGTRRQRHDPPRGRKWMLFPLIVPPVYEKHVLIRNNLSEIWANAEAVLSEADKAIFWGYSFPVADTHARHFFQSLATANPALRHPILINPDPRAAEALWQVLRPREVEHFRDAKVFLGDD